MKKQSCDIPKEQVEEKKRKDDKKEAEKKQREQQELEKKRLEQEKKEEEERLASLRAAPVYHGVPVPAAGSSPQVIAGNRKEQRRLEAKQREERARVLKPLQDELAALEENIANLEGEKASLAKRLEDPALYDSKEEAMLVARSLQEAGQNLEKLYSQWNTLAESIERKEAEIAAFSA